MVRSEQIQEFLKIAQTGGARDAWIDLSAASATSVSRTHSRPRILSQQAGRGLEILGHAIDYLVDEYVLAGGEFCEEDPTLQAVFILMSANREIYFSCPLRPTLFERLRKKVAQLGL